MPNTREKLIELLKDGGVRDFPFVAALADHIITSGFIEELQNEAYDLGVDSALHNRFGLSWEDAAGLRKEITRLQEATKWIPVKERLPDPFVSVLVQMPGEEPFPTVREGFISNDGIWQSAMFRREPGEVTHWQPMPQPPKGE